MTWNITFLLSPVYYNVCDKRIKNGLSFRGVAVIVLNSAIISKFQIRLHYYVYIRTNIIGKGMKPLISSHGLGSTTTIRIQLLVKFE